MWSIVAEIATVETQVSTSSAFCAMSSRALRKLAQKQDAPAPPATDHGDDDSDDGEVVARPVKPQNAFLAVSADS